MLDARCRLDGPKRVVEGGVVDGEERRVYFVKRSNLRDHQVADRELSRRERGRLSSRDVVVLGRGVMACVPRASRYDRPMAG